MSRKHIPPEIWIQIFRFATWMPPTVYDKAVSPFDTQQQEDLRSFGFNYTSTLRTKASMSRVCKLWRYLVFPFLWEILCLLPGRKYHAIGSILQRYNASTKAHPVIDDRRAGDYVRALQIFEPENKPPHELYDVANIQRIVRACPNLVTLAAPDGWQLFSRDHHISLQPNANLQEVHLSLFDEETIQRIFDKPERLLIVHGSNFEINGAHHRETILPSVHTISMRPRDMDDRNIFAPSLSRWVVHDTIMGIGQTRAYERHAALITSLELACTWCDRTTIQSTLSGMSNLQELSIHLNTMCLAPVPCCLPGTLRRLGFFCPYGKHGWVLNTDNGTFQWFLDHLDDWFGVAIQAQETLGLVKFLDWKGVRLPKTALSQRRSAYSAWWFEKLILFERAGIKLTNEDGSPLGIEIGRGSSWKH
jgi:F-box-like